MKKATKKVLSIALTVALMLSQFITPAFAEGITGDLLVESEIIATPDIANEIAPDDETETSEDDSVTDDGDKKTAEDNSEDEQPSIKLNTDESTLETPAPVSMPELSVQSISLDKSTLTLAVGSTEYLAATIEPQEAANQKIFWSSLYENIAVVDNLGMVTSISVGTTIITATTEDGNLTATCTVTTIDIPYPPGSLTAVSGDGEVILNWQDYDNRIGSIIKYQVSNDYCETWRDATDSRSYVFTDLINGTDYTFFVRAVNEIGTSQPSEPVTATPMEIFKIYGLNFTDTLMYGDTDKFVTTSIGGGSAGGMLSYESDNEAVISVNAEGRLTAHKVGTAKIKAIKQGEMAYEYTSMIITVIKKPISVSDATLAPKIYDGTTQGQVEAVKFNVLIDELVIYRDFTVSVEYDNENAGNNRTATVSVNLLNHVLDKFELDINGNTCQLLNQTIEKAPGGVVTVPVLFDSPTQTSVTVYTIFNETGTGQSIEYAISQESGVAPVSGWQEDTTFTNLTPDTTYYVYARTQESENYNAGTAKESAVIMTAPNVTESFQVYFNVANGIGQLTASVDGSKINSGDMVEEGKSVIFTATPDVGYNIFMWTDNGDSVNGSNSTYTINDISENHAITMEFEVQTFNVTVNSEGENHYGGGINPFEIRINIGAGKAPINKRFSHWETSSNGVMFDSAISSETYFIMPANDVTVTAVFEDLIPTVDSVTVNPDIADVQKGTSLAFGAEVLGDNNPGQSVIWEVLNGIPETMITSDGLLTISINETADTLTVRATSTVNSSKFGIATVNVTEVPPTVTSIDVTPDIIDKYKGENQTFEAIVKGENNPPQDVAWSVLGGNLGTVITSDGILSIDTNETADNLTIVATSTFDTDKSGVATVHVMEIPQIIPTVSSVCVVPDEISINKGDSYTFTAIVTGENSPPQDVIWSILGENSESSITPDGVLTIGIDEMASSLTVAATSTFDTDIFGTASIIVIQTPPVIATVTNVSVVPDEISITKGESHMFTVIITGENNPAQTVEWSVIGSNGMSRIDEDGLLTIDLNETATTLTVKAVSTVDSSKYGIATVNIREISNILPTVTSVEISPDIISLKKGGTHTFTATVIGDNNPPQSVSWSVIGDTDGTTITSDGILTIGTNETSASLAVVATSEFDISKSGIALITVIEELPIISNVGVAPNATSMNKGDKYTFSAIVTGSNNPGQSVTWSVIGGNNITNIDSSGTLTVDIDETATVLIVQACSTIDSSRYGFATVSIMEAPPVLPIITDIKITPENISLHKGDSNKFTAIVTGTNNPPQSVDWSVLGGTAETTINSDGILTVGINETSASLSIVATSMIDSSKYGTAVVIVTEVPPLLPTVTDIVISPDAISLNQGDSFRFSATVMGENNPPQDVVWSIIGEVNRTTIAEDGTLHIGAGETAGSLTIVATSAFDMSKSCAANVTVIQVPPTTPTVSNVDVVPNAVSLNKGDSFTFLAVVSGTDNPYQAVTWSVVGGKAGTNIDSTGNMIIAADETAAKLTVIATSVADNTKTGTATITILHPPTSPTVTSVEISPNSVKVEKGSTFAFVAYVSGNYNPSQAVIWSVSGGTTGTSIDVSGTLTVSDNETAETLVVKATSMFDNSKFATVMVSIPQSVSIIRPQTPIIETSPESATVYTGQKASLSVIASVTDGGTLTYQWFRNNINANSGGVLIDGAVDAVYTPPTGAAGKTYYYVVVTNVFTDTARARTGAAIITSDTAAITVYNHGSGGTSGNNGGSNNNGGSQNSGDNSDTSTETKNDATPTKTVDILVNGQTVKSTVNKDGRLAITYTNSDIKKYANSKGNYVIEIAKQNNILLSIPIVPLGKDNLTIKTDYGSIKIPNKTLQDIRKLHGDILRITIKKGSFIIALVNANGKEISYNNTANPFIITLPYVLADWQQAYSVTAVKKTNGSNIIIPFSLYKDGSVTFVADSTGTYDVLYNKKIFNDTENHPVANAISFITAKELFSDIGGGNFAPDETMTRAMFLTVLARIDGVDLSQYKASRFSDVSPDEWYAASIEWAASKNLVIGVGNGKFAPNSQITGEQMDIVFDNYIKYKNCDINLLNLYELQSRYTRAEAVVVFVKFIEALIS